MDTLHSTIRHLSAVFAVLLCLMAPGVSAGEFAFRSTESERIEVAHNPDLNPSNAMTIEAWVRPWRLSTSTGCGTIVGKNFRAGYWLGLCNRYLRYYTNGAGTSRNGHTQVPLYEWSHIAVTFDGTKRHYYVNGVLDYTATTPGPLPNNNDPLGIGSEVQENACWNHRCSFDGNIAEVRIWNFARTRDQIRQDINIHIKTPRAGLIAAWSFDNTAKDFVGYHHGMEVGAGFSGTAYSRRGYDGFGSPLVAEGVFVIPSMQDDRFANTCPGFLTRIPIWGEDHPRVTWLYLGATESHLRVCVDRIDVGPSFAGVYVDPDADGGTLAQFEDFRLVQPNAGALTLERGAGLGGFQNAIGGTAGVVANRSQGSGSTHWKAAFDIPRELLELGPNGTFGLQIIDDQDNSASSAQDRVWPLGGIWNQPSRYQRVRIDDTIRDPFPPAVSSAKQVYWHAADRQHIVGFRAFDHYASEGMASGVSRIDVYLNGAFLNSCTYEVIEFDERGDHTDRCDKRVDALPAGFHTTSATATDYAGNTDDRTQWFWVNGDGSVTIL